jgi:L-ascorbate metabolism protein UlaG (beta-lactamase superfamily)
MFDVRRVRRQIEEARRAASGRRWPATFTDRLTAPLPKARDVLRMMRQWPPRAQLLADADQVPVRREPELPRVGVDRTAVTWVGHATYVVQIGGLIVLTDPVWSRKIPGVAPRFTPVGLDWDALPRVDAVVISHNHYDHLDSPTIRRLPRHTPLLVPGGLGWWFRRRGFRDVTELDWYESTAIDDVRFEFVPAHHWSRRTLTDTCRSLWGGWMLTAPDGAKVYFAGDTGYGHYFEEIGRRHPDIDLALMPVGAYEPNWFMKPVHMSPPEAVRACADLGARRMSTMHWGTFLLSAEPLLAPVYRAREAWAEAGRAREDLWDLAVGETRVVP